MSDTTTTTVATGQPPVPPTTHDYGCPMYDATGNVIGWTDQPQVVLDADPSDPHSLDPDGDGLACHVTPQPVATVTQPPARVDESATTAPPTAPPMLAETGVPTSSTLALAVVMIVAGIGARRTARR